ncbi:hypothetical protein I3843_12G079400 [Carya illinoinensis]|uniref:Uncharacterized protein n=1 Tax=Carya illinoinensis TaxID=32201 RepID=A0A8T1NY39_CARIL|nr:hypothetical protein I3760_12G077500 [Carya illinoinensis]KAG6633893.1 hypothetical protein CIPAW_12G080100 [Carya illinoinensis]KAG6684755.1 hypothetical protein I3842_12G078300 [Carya illinoinensis]KAG7952841.1 hypothetical protein I3843_12G079400 [Carya illinoinensis]
MEENSNSIISRETLDQVASWVGSTVVSAFFSSLERFSCLNVTTTDPDDDEDDVPMDRPLALHHQDSQNDVADLPV